MCLRVNTPHKIILFLSICFCLSHSAFGQVITLNFPRFAGTNWNLITFRGNQQDTLLSGKIPPDGNFVLNIPEKNRSYRGMARWILMDGGGLDFILNGESFSVECLSDQPNETNIFFAGTTENTFLNTNHKEQEILLAKFEVVSQALSLYPEGSSLHQPLAVEQQVLQESYARFLENLSQSKLYAARFREIVNFTRGIGRNLNPDENTRASDANDFVRTQLDFPSLYTSNHWGGVIYSWMQLHTAVLKSDSLLLVSINDVLGKLDAPELYTDFCEQIALYLVKAGKDSLLTALAPTVRNSGKLLHYKGLLNQFNALENGSKAPDIVLPNGQSIRLANSQKPTLLLFYQSTCGPCAENLDWLKTAYNNLKNKGIKIITLSADKDITEYKKLAADFQWPEAFCDLKGFNGPNFKAYGVIGTPTIIAVDRQGNLCGRFAGFTAAQSLIDKW